ncbi:MAG: hypothetical protein FWG66_07750 [Spirochaetes bacterium]|nr:hypothetical protein [Spirochaetota bacterium]
MLMIDLEYCYAYMKRDKKTYLRFHIDDQENFEHLSKTPHKEIVISGLNQKYFEYFCKNFAGNFEIIQIASCPLIKDFTPFELLEKAHFICIDWNNKATNLWNMSNNKLLKGLYLKDFKKVTRLDGIDFAPSLTELYISQNPDVKWFLETLAPLAKCDSLKNLNIGISGILDGSALPIVKMKSLEKANFRSDLFETEEFAMLAVKLKKIELSPNEPCIVCDEDAVGKKNVLIVGKNKPWLQKNNKKIKQYEDEWNEFVKKYEA